MNQVKVLIVRFSSIGDIVLTTPVIRCLKEQLEGEVILHYLTKKAYVPLLEANPHLDKIHSIEKSTNEVIADLEAEDFDYIIDLHKNLRSSRIKKKLKGLSFSFEKLNWEKWLLVNFKVNRLPNIHIVDRYLATCKALGIKNDSKGLDYFFPSDFQFKPTKDLPEKYDCLVLGANHATKKIPEVKLKEVIQHNYNPIVLIGGKEDQPLGEELQKAHSGKVYNYAGHCNLHESAWLIKNAERIITPDTGMMHIAAALNKPILSVWGNTVPEFGMYPYYAKGEESKRQILENKNLSCRPCSKIGYQKCPKGHFKCMMDLDFSEK